MIHISNLVMIKRWTTNILTFIKREMVSWKQSATYIAQKIIGRMDLILDNTRQNKSFTQVCIMMILRCNGLRKIYFLSVTSNVLNCMRYYVVRNLKRFKKTYTILFRCSPSRLSGSVNLINHCCVVILFFNKSLKLHFTVVIQLWSYIMICLQFEARIYLSMLFDYNDYNEILKSSVKLVCPLIDSNSVARYKVYFLDCIQI